MTTSASPSPTDLTDPHAIFEAAELRYVDDRTFHAAVYIATTVVLSERRSQGLETTLATCNAMKSAAAVALFLRDAERVSSAPEHPERRCASIQCARCFPQLGQAKVRFWDCPDHQGPPHRVEWHGGVAACLSCGRTSAYGPNGGAS